MLRKFTKADVDVIADAFDKYGFEEIRYVPREDVMYLVFQTKRTDMEDMNEAVKFVKSRIPHYNWAYERHRPFYERVGNDPDTMFIVSYCGWKKEVLE